MADLEKTIKALNDWIEEPNAINSEIDGWLVSDAVECLEEQQAKIKYLKSEKERLSGQNEALKKKKGHWEMKFRHHKSVKHVKGYDAYDVEREIELVEETEGYEPYCSECGAAAAESFLCFCPKCGADMRESIKKDGEQE